MFTSHCKMVNKRRFGNNHNYHLGNFLGALIVAQQKKKVSYAYWPSSKLILDVARNLRAEGFISGYVVSSVREATQITVFLKYHPVTTEPLLAGLCLYASPSRQYNIKYKSLVNLTRGKSNLYFLSTVAGVVTSEYCLSKGLGGNLLFRLQ